MLDNKLKSQIRSLWDKFWSGGISNPLTAIEQITYLLFLKKISDEDIRKVNNSKIVGNYKSIFEGEIENRFGKIGKINCSWNKIKELSSIQTDTDLGIIEHMEYYVFPFIIELAQSSAKFNYLDKIKFEIPTASLLKESMGLIDEIFIKSQNYDVKGDIYEYLLGELQTAGKNGQFRTPRHIIQMMVELVNPKLKDRIFDPACGTAGFLMNSYLHILKENTSKDLIKIDEEGNEYNFEGDKLTKQQKEILDKSICGIEIDPTMIRLSFMNLIMHGIDDPQISKQNTLSKKYDIKNENGKYEIILANPPFKGSIDENELNEYFTIKSKKTELLFLELIYEKLTIGGIAGVIIPEGVLFGSSKAHIEIRKLLLEKTNLKAVISMPSGVFKPYAGVSTSILIFQKGNKTDKVHFFEMKEDGFSLDDKRTKQKDKTCIPRIINQFNEIESKDFKDRKSSCFYVHYDEITNKENNYNLTLSNYKEEDIIEKEYDKPENIKKDLIKLENEIIGLLK